jgi:hypothetical protein
MKIVAWLVFALLPCSVVLGQQAKPADRDQDADSSVDIAAASPHDADAQDPKHTSAAAVPKPMKRTRIDGSMVGYIDDSTVTSEVRVRFDAGFNDPRPDRAEYFYAGSTTQSPSTDAIQRKLNFQELYLNAEYAPVQRFSVFFQLPFRWIQPTFFQSTTATPDLTDHGGISDVQAGVKVAVIASESRQLTLQLRASFPTGDGSIGLGTNHYTFEPMLLYSQRVSDRTAVEAEFGDSHPIGGTIFTSPAGVSQNFAGDVLMYGAGPSFRWIDRDKLRVGPVLELVAWHVFGGLQTGVASVVQSAGGINVFNAKLGARANFGNGSSIYVGYGRSLTSDIWYRNLLRVEYRRAF